MNGLGKNVENWRLGEGMMGLPCELECLTLKLWMNQLGHKYEVFEYFGEGVKNLVKESQKGQGRLKVEFIYEYYVYV